MRPHGKLKLGFFPLPTPEAERLRRRLSFPSEFSALDPCVGDGVAFTHLLEGLPARRYGIEIDANRAEQATRRGIETLQANTMDVRCPAEAFSLLYLNPPYDFESGQTNNQRLELAFLEHTYRWLKPGGVLLFVIPQPQLKPCARILSEHFTDLDRVQTHGTCQSPVQAGVSPGPPPETARALRDSALLDAVRWLEMLSSKPDLEAMSAESPSCYEVPPSGPAVLTNTGIPLDEVEDLLLDSAAYRQASRVLLPATGGSRQAADAAAWWACWPAVYRWNAQWRIWRGRISAYRPLAIGQIHRSLGRRGRGRYQDPARSGTLFTRTDAGVCQRQDTDSHP